MNFIFDFCANLTFKQFSDHSWSADLKTLLLHNNPNSEILTQDYKQFTTPKKIREVRCLEEGRKYE
jgi:hypothetical protein